jgi:ClpP class serine protease
MWLLEASVLERLQKAMDLGLEQQWLAASQKKREITAASPAVEDGLAVISVEGILTKQADPLVQFFYGANTAYDDINAQIGAAEANPKVTAIRFDIDSPGGNVDGLFDTLAAISASTKPKSVYARNALSAAYGIAAAAGGPITASGPGASFGSVGTAVSVAVSDSVVTLTSSNAPEKRPDPRTEEGRASIIRHLDAIDGLFVDAIAGGRGVSSQDVRNTFGRGASLLAGDAEQRGMIDGIAGAGLRVVDNGTQATAMGGSEAGMDLEQLKAEYPAVYKAAVESGVQQERDRVTAHIQLGESGDMKVALEAVKDGSEITQTTYSAHMAAAINRREVEARNDDNVVVDGATNGAKTEKKDTEDEFQGEVLARLKKLVGTGAIENG